MSTTTLFTCAAALAAVCSGASLKAVPNIVELAVSVPDLSTLVTAVKAAGLVETLESPGPFTVFAPTNEAFAALPAGVIEHLLRPENKAELAGLLTYHVVAGEVLSRDLKNGEVVKTVEGQNLTVILSDGGVFIEDGQRRRAQVIKADNLASNGVVHIINKVLLPAAPAPPAEKNIVELAVSVPDLSTLVTAVKAAGLVETLESPGPFTVFAPTNEAFAQLPAGVLEHLLRPENKAELAKVLTYHVVAGAVTASQIHDREIFKTVEGQGVEARVFDGKVFLQDRIAEDPRDFAQVVTADVSASNGVVHVINKVLLPL